MPSLLSVLAKDASAGPVVLRLAALSAMTSLFSVLSSPGSEDAGQGVSGLPPALTAAMVQSGANGRTLQGILAALDVNASSAASPFSLEVGQGTALHTGERDEIFYSAIAFLKELARFRDGRRQMLELGLLQRVSAIPVGFFPHRPVSQQWSTGARNDSYEMLCSRLAAVLRLLSCLAGYDDTRATVRLASFELLQSLRTPLETVLRFQVHTLQGMAVMCDVLYLLVQTSASAGPARLEKSALASTGSLWDDRLDCQLSESYQRSVHWLLSTVGASSDGIKRRH